MPRFTQVGLLIICTMCLPLNAALMKISFSGVVTSVENNATIFWDPSSTLNKSITGFMLFDTSLAEGKGREETSFYWWWNNDNGPGVLTSQFNLAGVDYFLTGLHDYSTLYNDWDIDEFLSAQSGVDDDGNPLDDALYFKDEEGFTTLLPVGELYQKKVLDISFNDPIVDFVSFIRPSGPPWVDMQPQFDREFHLIDEDVFGGYQLGGGSFDFYRSINDGVGNLDVDIDSRLVFNLSSVRAELVQVNAPHTLLLLIIGLVFCLFKVDSQQYIKARWHQAISKKRLCL